MGERQLCTRCGKEIEDNRCGTEKEPYHADCWVIVYCNIPDETVAALQAELASMAAMGIPEEQLERLRWKQLRY